MTGAIRITWQVPLSSLMAEKRERIPDVLHRVVTALAAEGTAHAKRLTPADTGRLRASITWRELFWVGGSAEAEIGTNVFYAPFVLGDVRPFIIRVRRKKALAWIVYRGGRSKAIRPAPDDVPRWRRLRKRGLVAYAKWVRHPGGRDVFGRTAEHLVRRAPAVVNHILKSEGIV
jgi:hypothetical protein